MAERDHVTDNSEAAVTRREGIGLPFIDAIVAQVGDNESLSLPCVASLKNLQAEVKPLVIRKLRDFLDHADTQVGRVSGRVYRRDERELWLWIASRLEAAQLSENARYLLELVGREAPEKKLSTVVK